MKQITIFDIIPETTRYIPCGYIDDMALIGPELRFNELKNMVGKKCIICSSRQSGRDYAVIRIIKYFENSDKVYKRVRDLPDNQIGYGEFVNDYIHDVVGIKECMNSYEIAYICDRVAFTRKENNKEADNWLSEMYCSNGRYNPINEYANTFYELRD